MGCSVSSPDGAPGGELKVRRRRSVFDELRGVSSGGGALCRVFDVSSRAESFLGEVSDVRRSVSSPGGAPRGSSGMLRCASCFRLSSRCFVW